MSLTYFIDNSIPQSMVADFMICLERWSERCPSDALLSFSLLSAGGRLCLDLTLNSATMHFKETVEGKSYASLKQALEKIFKSRLEGWRAALPVC